MLSLRMSLRPLRNLSALSQRVGAQVRTRATAAVTVPISYEPLADGSPDLSLLRSLVVDVAASHVGAAGIRPTEEDIALTVVTGGITNQLFRADFVAASQPPSSLLVRVFGGEGMIDRDIENAAFVGLSQAGVGVPYYGRFENGRIEGWLDGADPLELDEMALPDVSVRGARPEGKGRVPVCKVWEEEGRRTDGVGEGRWDGE